VCVGLRDESLVSALIILERRWASAAFVFALRRAVVGNRRALRTTFSSGSTTAANLRRKSPWRIAPERPFDLINIRGAHWKRPFDARRRTWNMSACILENTVYLFDVAIEREREKSRLLRRRRIKSSWRRRGWQAHSSSRVTHAQTRDAIDRGIFLSRCG